MHTSEKIAADPNDFLIQTAVLTSARSRDSGEDRVRRTGQRVNGTTNTSGTFKK
jgi:hypothetical protein